MHRTQGKGSLLHVLSLSLSVTHTHTHTHTHACMHTRACAHTHTHTSQVLLGFRLNHLSPLRTASILCSYSPSPIHVSKGTRTRPLPGKPSLNESPGLRNTSPIKRWRVGDSEVEETPSLRRFGPKTISVLCFSLLWLRPLFQCV